MYESVAEVPHRHVRSPPDSQRLPIEYARTGVVGITFFSSGCFLSVMTRERLRTQRAVSRCESQLPDSFDGGDVAFGFDGVVDTVREIIDERHGVAEYTPVFELEAIGDRIGAAVETKSSTTFEWTERATRTGGHVCHLTRALGTLDYRPTMIGTFGEPIDPIFRDEFDQYTTVTIGQPGHTDAVELADGKLMLTQSGDYRTLDWETLCDRLTLNTLADHLDGTRLLGLGYWSVVPSFPDILDGLRDELWPLLSSPPDHVLVDPGGLQHVPRTDLRKGADALDAFDDVVPTTVSANRSETTVVADLFDSSAADPERLADVARDGFGVSRFVSHGVDRSVSSTSSETASVAVPRVDDPELTTSAGDHFNAGLVVGLLTEVDEDAALVLGNSVAGWFVRNGTAPTRDQLRSFVETYLDRFDSGNR